MHTIKTTSPEVVFVDFRGFGVYNWGKALRYMRLLLEGMLWIFNLCVI